jgi:hypothetical protein
MSTYTTDPRLVRFSARIYSALLAGYPRRFRREYGPHMAQVFRDACLHTYRRSGPPGMLGLWALTLFDWFKTVIEEQLNRATEMTRAKWIRLSGWSMMTGAVAMQLGFLIDANWIRARMYRLVGPPTTRAELDRIVSIAEDLEGLPAMAGILLVFIGLTGLRQRYAKELAGKWQDGLTICAAGGFLTVAGLLGLLFSEAAWDVFIFGLSLVFGCLAVFGVVAVREGLLPAYIGLPLLACLSLPLLYCLSLVYEWMSGGQWLELPVGVSAFTMSAASVSLVLLGFELRRGTALVGAEGTTSD